MKNYKWIVRLEGGLGNQLFQYANARALQRCFGGKILLDLHTYNEKQIRSLSLNNFAIPTDVVFYGEKTNMLLTAYFRLLNRIASKLQIADKSNCRTYRIFSRFGLYQQYQVRAFENLIEPKLRSNYISGNWISPKFFRGIEDTLRRELLVKSEISDESKTLLSHIQSCNSVCVHVRLGDYLAPEWKDKLYICNEEYYQKAINLISSKVENPVFFIFSNRHKDITWLKENYDLKGNIVYVDLSNPDYADLKLMYSCKHFIMSNSTYSWWAQFLGSDKDKIVVAPSRFNNIPKWDMTDIYQDNWNIIKI